MMANPMGLSDPGPWASAPVVFNRFANLDHHEGVRLARLSSQQASDEKLASALEASRTYGFATHKFYYQKRKKMRREFKPPPVEAMW